MYHLAGEHVARRDVLHRLASSRQLLESPTDRPKWIHPFAPPLPLPRLLLARPLQLLGYRADLRDALTVSNAHFAVPAVGSACGRPRRTHDLLKVVRPSHLEQRDAVNPSATSNKARLLAQLGDEVAKIEARSERRPALGAVQERETVRLSRGEAERCVEVFRKLRTGQCRVRPVARCGRENGEGGPFRCSGGREVGTARQSRQVGYQRCAIGIDGDRGSESAVGEVGEGPDVQEGEEDHFGAGEKSGETDDDLLGRPIFAILYPTERDQEVEACDKI